MYEVYLAKWQKDEISKELTGFLLSQLESRSFDEFITHLPSSEKDKERREVMRMLCPIELLAEYDAFMDKYSDGHYDIHIP